MDYTPQHTKMIKAILREYGLEIQQAQMYHIHIACAQYAAADPSGQAQRWYQTRTSEDLEKVLSSISGS